MRVLIVDDEPLAREGLRLRLAAESGVAIVGEAGDVSSAEHAIRASRPDLVLLDIRLPGGDGFDVIRAVAAEHLPLIVFVTAHDEHAIRAFEVHALDYLLKPVSAARLRESLDRARTALGREEERMRLAAALDARNDEPPSRVPRFVVRERDRYFLVTADTVDWIGAAGNYVELHVAGARHLVRGTLSEIATRLDPARFARIHRSTIVRIDCVRDILRDSHGDFEVTLRDGTILGMSRTYRDGLVPRA